jgi:excisionase family DNA binding protein
VARVDFQRDNSRAAAAFDRAQAESNQTAADDLCPSPLLLRVREFADALGISISFAKQLVAAGKVRSIRIQTAVRIPASELERISKNGAR